MTYHGCLLENARKQIPGQMGEIMTAKDEKSLQPLRARLEEMEDAAEIAREMEREGVKLYVNGRLATSEYIVRHCINEDTVYMPDYVTDESGRVKEIRYDKIYMK